MKQKKRIQAEESRIKQKEDQQNMPLGAAVEANREKKRTGPNFPAT